MIEKRLDVAQREQVFRDRIVELVIASKYVRDLIPDDKIDAVAKKIGVDPEVLVEARMRFRVQKKLDGYQVPLGRKRRGTRHYQFKLAMPAPLYRIWRDEADFRGIEPSALLRSLIHAYLLGSYEPKQVLRYWVYEGKTWITSERAWEKKNKKGFASRERALITLGAMRALRVRAHRRGHVPTAVVRALVIEVLDGKHRSMTIVDAQSMYDDETRYRTEPGAIG